MMTLRAPLAAVPVQRAKVHSDLPIGVAPVAHADEDDLPFIALHVLQVLDEERFLRVSIEERFAGSILAPQHFQLIPNSPLLGRAERGHAQRQVGKLPRMIHDRPGDCLRLLAIGAALTAVVHRVREVVIL